MSKTLTCKHCEKPILSLQAQAAYIHDACYMNYCRSLVVVISPDDTYRLAQ
jgi:hypothetical protein